MAHFGNDRAGNGATFTTVEPTMAAADEESADDGHMARLEAVKQAQLGACEMYNHTITHGIRRSRGSMLYTMYHTRRIKRRLATIVFRLLNTFLISDLIC